MFEEIEKKLKERSKICLPQLREIAKDYDKYFLDFDKIFIPTLSLLLEKAIDYIDELKNGGEYDERDIFDSNLDKEYIFEELVNNAIKDCKLWEGENNGKF